MTMPCVIPSYGDEPPTDVVFIRVEPYTGVDLEFFKVGSFDYDGSCLSMRDLTTTEGFVHGRLRLTPREGQCWC